MTTQELYDKVIDPIKTQLGENVISPLHKAMIEECCERGLEAANDSVEEKELILSVQIGFVTADKALKGLVEGLQKDQNADTCTINYRGQSFVIDKNLKHLR
jgi:hypothetical protein